MSGIPGTITPCDSQGPAERSEVGPWESHVSLTAASSPTPVWRPVRLVQLNAPRPDPGRDASGSSNLLNPGCTLSPWLRGHRTGYTGDLTERSRPGPLDALTDIPFEDAKSAYRRWPDGSMTSRLRLNDVVPLSSFLHRRCFFPRRRCWTRVLRVHFSFAREQSPGIERLAQRRHMIEANPRRRMMPTSALPASSESRCFFFRYHGRTGEFFLISRSAAR